MSHQDVFCFQCGHAVGDPPQLNELEDGTPCLSCSNRVLDTMPSLLPAEPAPERAAERQLDLFDVEIPAPAPADPGNIEEA